MNRYVASVPPCSSPATMSNKFVSSSGERTFIIKYSIIMAATISLGKAKAKRTCLIFPMCIESNTLEKSSNKFVASRFFKEHLLKVDRVSEFVILRIDFFENHFDFSQKFSQFLFRCCWVAKHYKS